MPAQGFHLDQSILSIRKLDDGTRTLHILPLDADVVVSGEPDEEGLIEVFCAGDMYYVFSEDLKIRAKRVTVDSRQPADNAASQRSWWFRRSG